MREVILKVKQKDAWAGVIRFRKCFITLGSAATRAGVDYTGLSAEDRARLEEAIGYPKGHLDPKGIQEDSFWKTYAVRVGTDELVIRPEASPNEELKFLFLKNHPLVQYGVKDLKPDALCILVDREAEAERENKTAQIRREANREFDKMNLDSMRQALRIFGINATSLSNELVENKLFKIVEEDPKRFLERWVNNKNKLTEFLIETAISKNIIRRNKDIYSYGTDVIGRGLDDVIAYINDKKNQDLKFAIEAETKNKE